MKQCLHHPKTPPPPVSSDHSHLHILASANIVEIANIDEKQSFTAHALEAT
jgi:hypothetical protein